MVRPTHSLQQVSSHGDDGDWPIDRGRPLGLRLLALLGAFSFVMLGLASLAPLLHPPQRLAPPRQAPIAPPPGLLDRAQPNRAQPDRNPDSVS